MQNILKLNNNNSDFDNDSERYEDSIGWTVDL